MTPGKLNKKWQKRLEDTDEESIAHKLITEFLIDIEWLHVEPTKEEIETRELLSRIVDRMEWRDHRPERRGKIVIYY